MHLFDYKNRKKVDGQLADYEPLEAQPRLNDRDPLDLRSKRLPYIDREQKVSKLLTDNETKNDFAMRRVT